jgi:F420-dependent oxidoreductase-like protein
MVEGQEDVTWPQWRDLAEAADRLGFDGLYSSDHYLSEAPGSGRSAMDAWGTVCAVATITSRIRLGTVVSPVTFRHPSVLAKLVVTADQISGGRIDLAMGTGWFEEEHTAYGFPFPPRHARLEMLEEQLEIVRRTWARGPFSFQGRHYTLTELDAHPKPVQEPHPRLVVGGSGSRRSIALAARWADEYNSPGPTDDQIRERRAGLAHAYERESRDPATARLSIMTNVIAGRDRRELETRAAEIARFYGDDDSDPAACLERLPETWVVGTPDQIVARIRELGSLGVNRVILEPIIHTDLEMIELIGREVVPAVRATQE